MFTYKGVRSKDVHLRVLNDVSFTSPTRDVTRMQIPGRDGDLIIDNGRYSSVVRSIPCRLEAPSGANVEQLMSRINHWLIDDGRFHPFKWENDPEFMYLARVEGDVVSRRMLSRYANTVIDFRMHPIKYLESSLAPRQIPSGWNVVNPFGLEAKPTLRIVGSGNILVTINGRELSLRNIEGGCLVDSETQTITSLDGEEMLFSQMLSPFPVLEPGDNQVTIFGSEVQLLMTPRLGALV